MLLLTCTACSQQLLHACSADLQDPLQVSHELATAILDPDTLAAAGKWMPAAELVQLLHRAETQSQIDWQRYGPSVTRARDVHDAVIG